MKIYYVKAISLSRCLELFLACHLLILGTWFINRLTMFSILFFAELFRYHLIFALSIYIMSSKQTDASPVPVITSPGIDEVDKVNFLNLQCHISSEKAVPSPSLSDAALRERLKAVLLSCHSALHQTKTLTDNYVSWELFKNCINFENITAEYKQLDISVKHECTCYQI